MGVLPHRWCNYDPHSMLSLLRGKHIVFVGGSTTRNLADQLLRQLSATVLGDASPCVRPCDATRGHGCSHCAASGCVGKSMGYNPKWQDFDFASSHEWDVRVTFSWKPETYTVDDATFLTQLCQQQPPPDLLVLAKGVHDIVTTMHPRLGSKRRVATLRLPCGPTFCLRPSIVSLDCVARVQVFRRGRRVDANGTLDRQLHAQLVGLEFQVHVFASRGSASCPIESGSTLTGCGPRRRRPCRRCAVDERRFLMCTSFLTTQPVCSPVACADGVAATAALQGGLLPAATLAAAQHHCRLAHTLRLRL